MALKDSMFQKIVEQMSGIVLVIDEQHRIQYINHTVPGLRREDVIGKNQLDFVHAEHRTRVEETCRRVLETGGGADYEVEGAGPNGETAHYSTRVTRLTEEDGTPMLVLFTTDITEAKQSTQRLMESDSIRKGLIQNVPGMVYRGNPDWSIDIMHGCHELSGYTPEEICAMEGNWLAIIHPEDKARVIEHGGEMVKKPLSLVQHYRIVTKSGETRWIEDRKTSLFKDGALSAVDGILFDITERRDSEEELKRVQEQLIAKQRQAILELSTPVIQIWDEILVLPLIGTVDTMRARQVLENLLEAISRTQASVVIIDITGVPVIDTRVANHLLEAIGAAKTIGTEVIVTGVSPHNARTLTKLRVDLSAITTKSSLQRGLKVAFQLTEHKVVPAR